MSALGVKGASGAGVSTSDAQYMQQQSQIFVFTTLLANKAAEAVIQGSFNNIIAFHCAQPGTKKLLEVLLAPGYYDKDDLFNSFVMQYISVLYIVLQSDID